MIRRTQTLCVALLVTLSTTFGSVYAVDFLRGDANSDGKVTIADAAFVSGWLFLGMSAPECLKAADANDDGRIQIDDAASIFNYVAGQAPQVAEPLGEPGPDETEDDLTCDSWGGNSGLEADVAELAITVEDDPFGEADKRLVTIYLSSSEEVSGFGGSFELENVANIGQPIDLAEIHSHAPVGASVSGNRVDFAWLGSFVVPASIGSVDGMPVMAFRICMAKDTPAGEYAIVPGHAELIEKESRLPIAASMDSAASVVIDADFSEDMGCQAWNGNDGPIEPGDLPVRPDQINATLTIGDASGFAGGVVTLPYIIHNNAETQGFSFSIDFDETVLEAVEVEQRFEKPNGSEWGFWRADLNNDNFNPGGDGGIDEGFIVGAGVMSFRNPFNNIPADEHSGVEVMGLQFRVRDDAPIGRTIVRFVDGGQGAGDPVKNVITSFGEAIDPTVAESFVFIHGVMEIVGDVTLFLRGDANQDNQVDLSDAQTMLSFLFLGGHIPCLDAGDANDDGDLNIADPIRTLTWLFQGGEILPPPNITLGRDPTFDGLDCSFVQ